MKMGLAISRPRAARMTAEGDGLALFIAAIGVAAIAPLQLYQGEMPWLDRYAAQLDRFDLLEHRRRPGKRKLPEIAGTRLSDVAQVRRLGGTVSGDRPPSAPGAGRAPAQHCGSRT